MRKQELHPRTAVINKSQKNQSKIARLNALQWLAATFPEAFDNSTRIRPLKLGIMGDILQYAHEAEALGISKSKLREAVVIFTRRIDYLTCLKAREMRIDLNGNPVNEVNNDESERASDKIKKRVEKSTRNARKINEIKPTETSSSHAYHSRSADNLISDNSHSSQPATTHKYPGAASFPSYPKNASNYAHQDSAPQKVKAPVMIKHKSTKTYDPDAVARLKEKLGLSTKADKKQETTE